MRKQDPPIAIVGSDLHLTDRVPIARAEKNWLEVLAGYLVEVELLRKSYGVPFLVAGDVFDKPNPSPAVVNFAFDHLPDRTWAIPGQHDLQYHNYEDIDQTAYWTLVMGGKIKHLIRGQAHVFASFEGSEGWAWYVVGWPWGSEPTAIEEMEDTDNKFLALVHSYIWTKGHKFKNAPQKAVVSKWEDRLDGYDAAVFGDNHKGFNLDTNHGKLSIMNCGTFVRRKVDEKEYRPMVGILHKSGSITPYYLHTENDRWATPEELVEKYEELEDFNGLIEELNTLGSGTLDFLEALQAGIAAKQVGRVVGDIIRKAAEEKTP
jgi:hypothetical protein